MLMSYQECSEKYGTDYKIKKSVQDGKLFVKEKESIRIRDMCRIWRLFLRNILTRL